MKKALLICVIFLLGSQFINAQITFRGCTSNALGAQDYVLVVTGTTNDAGTIRNTYESNPTDFTQGCPAGVCEIRIMWNIGAARWEVQLDNDGPVGSPDYTTACLYFNAAASVPNPPDLTLGSWFDCSGGLCPVGEFVTFTGDVQSTLLAGTPEIDITGLGTSILDGDVTPIVGDDTEFGSVGVALPSVHTFTVDNTVGTGDLNVTTITSTGANSADFVVGGIILPATVSAGTSTTFTVTFTPGAVGLRTATITVNNDDADESVYNYAVQGTGILSTDRYWVGGDGSWSDVTHWALFSGGPGGNPVPLGTDDVYFDAASALGVGNVVILDVNGTANNFDFSGVATSFTFNSPGPITMSFLGSINGNLPGVLFTGVMQTVNMLGALPGETLTSGGTIWSLSNFIISGEAITLADNFSIAGSLNITNGGFVTGGNDVTCLTFSSAVITTRTITITGSIITVNDGFWEIVPTNLTWAAASSEVLLLDNAGLAVFTGGGVAYDTLRSTTATAMNYVNSNTFSLFEIVPSSSLFITVGDDLSTDSLIATGTCGAPAFVSSLGVGTASITKTGFLTLNLQGMDITDVDAIAPAAYNVFASAVTTSLGWTLTGGDFFWVGGPGNWSDGAHWSFTSGGLGSGCVPGITDDVFFDAASGLIAADIVTMDITVGVNNIDFSGVATTFTFDSPLALAVEFRGSIIGNASGALFTGTWPFIDMNTTLTGESITSGGTVWIQDFTFNGEMLTLIDDFNIGAAAFAVDSGGVDMLGNTVTCGTFSSSTTATRSIDITNASIIASLGDWTVDSTSLTWASGTSEIFLGDNAGIGTFTGGSLPYDTLRSTSATFLSYLGNNSFDLFELVPFSDFRINNGDTLYIDSLIAVGDCPTRLNISTIGAGANGAINKTGFGALALTGVNISNVDAVPASAYNLTTSSVSNASGWNYIPTDFYWIGEGGNWTDVSHWSFSSGGGSAGCLPYISDSVYFDVNSFFLPAQDVVVNDTAYFGSMQWVGFTGNQTLSLDSTMWGYGDVIFDPNLTVKRNVISAGIRFNDQADLFPYSASIDCSFSVAMPSPVESLLLKGDLLMSDTSSILIFNGKFSTENNDMRTGSFITINDPFTGLDARDLDFGSSNIHFVSQFSSKGDTNLVFNSGTSDVYVGDTITVFPDTISYSNGLHTEGLTFFDVTLNFQPLNIGPFILQQSVTGANTFNKLEVIPGSHVYLDSNITQTVNDSLILQGNCLDSIWLQSLDTSVTNIQASISKATTTDILAECLNVADINYLTPSITAYFSTDLGNNSANWTFSALNSTDASYTYLGEGGTFCLGDTVFFTNISTAFSGVFGDLTSTWIFNDDTLGFVSDTNAHIFNAGGQFDVSLVTIYTNFCTDTATQQITINDPIVYMTSSEFDYEICQGDSVTFEASSPDPGTLFEFFLNGVSILGPGINDTLYITTALNNGDSVSVLGYLNGCVTDSMPSHLYTVNALPVYTMTSTDADTTICAGDLVSFTGTGGLPTDLYEYQLNGANVTSQTLDSTYSTTTLIDNDSLMLIGETTSGCIDTALMVFNVDPLPTTALTSTELGSIICQSTNVTFTASGATTYQFFINGVPQGPVSATTTFSTSALTATDTVTVMGYLVTNCSFEAPESFNYAIIATPAISLSSSDVDLTICGGDNVLFTSSGGINYEFFVDAVSQGASSPINNFSTTALTNGQTVTVVGELGGCFGPSPGLTFVVVTSPTTTLSSSDLNDTICQGESVIFTGTGATNYEFFVGGISQGPSSPTATLVTSALIDGQTILLIGESNGCPIQDQLTYVVLPSPSINLFSDDANNTICDGDPVTFTSANGASYQLYVNGSPFGPPQASSTFVNPTLPIGTNALYMEGTAVNGCASNSLPAMVFTVNPIPVVVNTSSVPSNIICAGEAVTFTGSGSLMYQFFIDGASQTVMSATSTFTTSTLVNGQTIDIVGSSLGCTSTSNSIVVTVTPVPVVTLTNTDPNNIWCINELITFNAAGAANYEFIVDGVSQGPSSPISTINSSTFVAGSYVVQVIGEQTNCYGNASMGIVINPLPIPTLVSSDIDDIICSGESVTYAAGGGATYEFFVDGVSQGIPSVINTLTSGAFTNGQVISVVVSTAANCTANASAVPLTVNPTPVVTLVSSDPDTTICVGDNVTFTASGAANYEFFVNGVSQGPPSPTATFSTSTLSNLDVVEVTGSLIGCTDSPGSLIFTVYSSPVVSMVNNGTIEICTGELTDLLASGAANYQFMVNGVPTGPFAPAATFNLALADGDVVTVAGELNGCITTSGDSFTFTVYNFPTLASTSSDADNIICLNDLISFTASGAMAYDFQLNGSVLQSGAGTTFDISTLVDGDVISIIGFNGDCPSTADTYVFTVNSMTLNLVATPSNMICEGDAATLTATGADSYEFFLNGVSTGPASAINTYSSSTFNDLDEVTFTAFNATTGCTQTYGDYVIMNVVDEPSISALSPTDFCEGDSVILISGASHGNQWYVDGAVIPGATDTSYVSYTSGVYTVETTSGGLGTVWSFGQNANGTIGNGENLNSADPAAATSLETFDELTSGYDFVLGVTTSGELFAWGDNSSGQLGDGTYTGVNLPQAVPTLTGIKTAATSESSSMAVTTAGDVYVWGNNTQGQLATGNTSVINFPFLNAALANTDSIAGGRNHFIILQNDGTVWAVGNNDFGQLGQGDLSSSLVALQVLGLSNVVSVGAGEYHSFAIDNLGDLYVWGNNGSGQLGLGDLITRLNPALSDLDDIINAQGGASHSAFLGSNNKVYTSGGNGFGQLGSTTFLDLSSPYEVNVAGATMISTGQYTTLVKRTDNSVFGFGNNTEDQLSSLSGLTVPTPEHIVDLDGVQFIEAGRFTSNVIYNEDQACTSPGMTVNMLTVPIITITVNGDSLTATAGASYQWYINGNPIPGATNQIHEATTSGDYTVEVTFANGCTGTSAILSHSVVGIENLSFGTIQLYPNPATDELNLIFATDILENTTFVVVDQAGRKVLDGEIYESDLLVDVSELESGMYNLIITNDRATSSLRFVKSGK